LVSIESSLQPGQIRNSNSAMLAAQISAAGAIPVMLPIARDSIEDLLPKIQLGLQSDVLVLSGGVSAGMLDLVPSTLARAGVKQAFHKVEIKPGKPIWFGVFERQIASAAPSEQSSRPNGHSHRCFVFGLPGNPVSSLVCCELFVRTALRRLMGIEPAVPQPILAKLTHDYSTRSDRPTYHPAEITPTPEGLKVALVKWHGSSDLCGTVAANGMALIPSGNHSFRAGDPLQTYPW
jgi:molybdopterin molybdotransferase